MARSCFFAAALVLNVPRFLRLPALGFFFREYSRYLSAFSFLIMTPSNIRRQNGLRALNCRATSSVADLRHAGGAAAYKGLGERFETQRTTNAARIARFVAK